MCMKNQHKIFHNQLSRTIIRARMSEEELLLLLVREQERKIFICVYPARPTRVALDSLSVYIRFARGA